MLEIKKMKVAEFMETGHLADKEKLERMYKLIDDNRKKDYVRLFTSTMPLYYGSSKKTTIFGGGDCQKLLSHREGYGYTIIDVGDRGSWSCDIYLENAKHSDIIFYDGEFEEVYERLVERF